MFTSSYRFDSVFWNSFQLSAEPKWVCYIKQNCNMIDGVMQSLELVYTHKFQKAGMSILGDAKSYYVKNSSTV